VLTAVFVGGCHTRLSPARFTSDTWAHQPIRSLSLDLSILDYRPEPTLSVAGSGKHCTAIINN